MAKAVVDPWGYKHPLGSVKRLIEVAKKELGVVEGPKDNETKYGAFAGSNFNAWCGSFVVWCFNRAGVELAGGRATIYTPNGAAAFKKAKAWTDADKADPRPGDVVYFDFPSDGVDRISHVGIVIKNNGDGTVVTIEGNTAPSGGDQRNGGMVLEKVRGFKKNKKNVLVSIVGFGRPKFVEDGAKAVKPKAEPKSYADPLKYPGNTVDPGEVGEPVMTLQKALGFKGKMLDSYYGPVMKKSIIAFQKANAKCVEAKEVDGKVGPVTWKALVANLKKADSASASSVKVGGGGGKSVAL